MIHALENMSENMHALLEHMLDQFARSLRKEYPAIKFREQPSMHRQFQNLSGLELLNWSM